MPDYSKGKIYTIRSHLFPEKIYVGSTVQKLTKRWQGHKRDCKNKHTSLYNTINNCDEWYIELFEEYPCETVEQLTRREGEIIRLIGTLNQVIAGRTSKEYREDNKEKIKEREKEYREDNKEKIKERKKEYREKNKEKIKEYKEKNKEKIKEQHKEYREKNKEKIMKKVECCCGSVLSKKEINTTRHKNTKRHQDYLKTIENEK